VQLQSSISAHQAREEQVTTETGSAMKEKGEEIKILQSKLGETREALSKAENESALQLAKKDAMLRYSLPILIKNKKQNTKNNNKKTNKTNKKNKIKITQIHLPPDQRIF
jgi:hypothetical protein